MVSKGLIYSYERVPSASGNGGLNCSVDGDKVEGLKARYMKVVATEAKVFRHTREEDRSSQKRSFQPVTARLKVVNPSAGYTPK